jgi:hypothetical protein
MDCLGVAATSSGCSPCPRARFRAVAARGSYTPRAMSSTTRWPASLSSRQRGRGLHRVVGALGTPYRSSEGRWQAHRWTKDIACRRLLPERRANTKKARRARTWRGPKGDVHGQIPNFTVQACFQRKRRRMVANRRRRRSNAARHYQFRRRVGHRHNFADRPQSYGADEARAHRCSAHPSLTRLDTGPQIQSRVSTVSRMDV